MEYEVYHNIIKGKIDTLRRLQNEELPWAWFVCCCIAKETDSAAELLRLSWKSTLEMLSELVGCPRESFRVCFSEELFRLSDEIPPGNDMFSSFPKPELPKKFDCFAEVINGMEEKEKRIYLLNKFGGLGVGEFSEILGIPATQAKEYLYSLEKKFHPKENGKAFSDYILLSNEFRSTNKRLFENICLPELLINTLEHDYNSIYNSSVKYIGKSRKDSKEMAQQNKKTQTKPNTGAKPASVVNRRAVEKKKKTIIISAVAAVLVIALIITIVLAAKKNNMTAATRITTYNIDEITYGNVSTTISGSGSLSPITKETLTIADFTDYTLPAVQNDSGGNPNTAPTVTGVISDVSVSVGDSVAEGEVIAVVTFDDATTANIVAPYDAVLLEFHLHDEDTVTLTSNVAMFMGTDGYSMTISVDENNISTVKLGQEVGITIDAVSTDEEVVGSVTDISYNGSTSGSVTAYGIEVTFDYVEGTYPGMSVSAEIVIEDSGDGLLVPVDAVYTSGDTNYVYLAPGDAVLGDEYEEGDIDTSKLSKVTVETGMSDGTYIIIESSQLSEGDLIVITEISSTLTGSENEGSGNGGFGGGGGMGGFPGGGNFDFGSFDPSQFGGSFPGFGG